MYLLREYVGTRWLVAAADAFSIRTDRTKSQQRRMHREGFRYIKAGVMLLDLQARTVHQGDLFEDRPAEVLTRRSDLMATLDRVNARWGRGALGIETAALQAPRQWSMKRGAMSLAYTTDWASLPTVGA